MGTLGRAQLVHPNLGTAGGSALYSDIETLYTKLSNGLAGRYTAFSSVANGASFDIQHDYGVAYEDFAVTLYTGTYPSLTRITDPAAAGWTIAATSGSEKTKITVTAPGSGGPHTGAIFLIHGGSTRSLPSVDGTNGQVLSTNGSWGLLWKTVPPVASPAFTTKIGVPDGTLALPGLSFTSDEDGSGTGIYRVGANSLGFVANGVEVGKYTSAGNWTLGASGNTGVGLTVNGGCSFLLPTAGGPSQFNFRNNSAGGSCYVAVNTAVSESGIRLQRSSADKWLIYNDGQNSDRFKIYTDSIGNPAFSINFTTGATVIGPEGTIGSGSGTGTDAIEHTIYGAVNVKPNTGTAPTDGGDIDCDFNMPYVAGAAYLLSQTVYSNSNAANCQTKMFLVIEKTSGQFSVSTMGTTTGGTGVTIQADPLFSRSGNVVTITISTDHAGVSGTIRQGIIRFG